MVLAQPGAPGGCVLHKQLGQFEYHPLSVARASALARLRPDAESSRDASACPLRVSSYRSTPGARRRRRGDHGDHRGRYGARLARAPWENASSLKASPTREHGGGSRRPAVTSSRDTLFHAPGQRSS
jgi:hypothetical protein